MIYRLDDGHIVSTARLTGIPLEELIRKREESLHERKAEQDKQWAIGYLGKDEQWYEEAMKKIGYIESNLVESMNHKEKTIKLYGWIADTIKKDLSIPLESDYEYARASSIELILTNPDLYNKIIHWD